MIDTPRTDAAIVEFEYEMTMLGGEMGGGTKEIIEPDFCRSTRKGRCGAWTHPEIALRGDDNPMRKYPHLVMRGEDSVRSKLTNNQVSEILALGKTIRRCALSRAYGVVPPNIKRILDRRIWRHIEPVNITEAMLSKFQPNDFKK